MRVRFRNRSRPGLPVLLVLGDGCAGTLYFIFSPVF